MIGHIACAELVINDVIEVETVHLHFLHLSPDGHSPHLPEAHDHEADQTEPHHHPGVHHTHNAVALVPHMRPE